MKINKLIYFITLLIILIKISACFNEEGNGLSEEETKEEIPNITPTDPLSNSEQLIKMTIKYLQDINIVPQVIDFSFDTKGLILPTYEYGVRISWEVISQREYIIINPKDGTVVINRPKYDGMTKEVRVNLEAILTHKSINQKVYFNDIIIFTQENEEILTPVEDIKDGLGTKFKEGNKVSFQGKVVAVSDLVIDYRKKLQELPCATPAALFNTGNFFIITDGRKNLLVQSTSEEVFNHIVNNIYVGMFIMIIDAVVMNVTSGTLGHTSYHSLLVNIDYLDNIYKVDESRIDRRVFASTSKIEGQKIVVSKDNLNDINFLKEILNHKDAKYLGVRFEFEDITFYSDSARFTTNGYNIVNQGETRIAFGLYKTDFRVTMTRPYYITYQEYSFTGFFISVGTSGVGTPNPNNPISRPVLRLSMVNQ